MTQYLSQKWARGVLVLSSSVLNTLEISDLIGIVPTETHEQERVGAILAGHLTAVWVLKSGLPDEATLEEHIETLLGKVTKHSEVLTRLAQDCSIELHLMFSSDNGQGSLTVAPQTLIRLAKLPLSLSLTLCYPEDFAASVLI